MTPEHPFRRQFNPHKVKNESKEPYLPQTTPRRCEGLKDHIIVSSWHTVPRRGNPAGCYPPGSYAFLYLLQSEANNNASDPVQSKALKRPREAIVDWISHLSELLFDLHAFSSSETLLPKIASKSLRICCCGLTQLLKSWL